MDSGITSPPRALVAAYRRSAWLGIGVGLLAGVVIGLVVGLQGYPGDLPIFLVQFVALGCLGAAVIVGLTAAVVAGTRTLRHPSRARRLLVSTVAPATAVALVGGIIYLLAPWWMFGAVVPVALVAALVGSGLAVLAERSADRPDRPVRVAADPGRSPLPPIAILAGVVAMIPFGGALVTLLRDRLHALCSYGEPGTEAAGWMCPDGISYLGAGFLPLGVGALLGLLGLVSALADRVPRRRRATLTVLAMLVVAAGILTTWPRATGGAGDAIRTEAWMLAVLPAVIVAVVALAAAIAALLVAGRVALVLTWVGVGGLLLAIIVQPGLGIATAPALGLILAATVEASSGSDRLGG